VCRDGVEGPCLVTALKEELFSSLRYGEAQFPCELPERVAQPLAADRAGRGERCELLPTCRAWAEWESCDPLEAPTALRIDPREPRGWMSRGKIVADAPLDVRQSGWSKMIVHRGTPNSVMQGPRCDEHHGPGGLGGPARRLMTLRSPRSLTYRSRARLPCLALVAGQKSPHAGCPLPATLACCLRCSYST